jgi:hypothetical protein
MVRVNQRPRHPAAQSPTRWCHASRTVRLCRVFFLVSVVYSCVGLNVLGQTSESQTAPELSQSWTVTTDSSGDSLFPTRIPTRVIERHTQNGNQTLDERSVQIRGTDGDFETYQDIEKEKLELDANTVRTTTRTFGRDANGTRALVQVTEEERRTLPGGDSQIVRTSSNPDVNGKLQPVQREIVETKRGGTDTEETNATVMLPSANSGLAPAFKTHEVRKEDANHRVESQETTSLPDVNGNWQVAEVRKSVTQQEATQRVTEETVSRLDAEGKLGEVSRVVSKESGSPAGENRSVVESYSVDLPGTTRDGSLHLVERATTMQHTSARGEQITQKAVEQTNPGDPGAGLRVSILVNGTMLPGPSGEESSVTIRARDSNGSLGVVSVDTSKSDKVTTIQLQPTPSASSR